MADMLHATAAEIRAELKTLDARRSRLRKLLAIAEEDETGKAPAPKPEAAPTPAPEPPAAAAQPPVERLREHDMGGPAKAEPRAETTPPRRPGR